MNTFKGMTPLHSLTQNPRLVPQLKIKTAMGWRAGTQRGIGAEQETSTVPGWEEASLAWYFP